MTPERLSDSARSTEDNMTDETTGPIAPPKVGRPPGSRNVSNPKNRQLEVAGKAIARNVVQVANVLIQKALEGDVKAADMVLSRAFGKGRLIKFPMIPIENPGDVKTAIAGFINGVAQGILTVDEAERLVSMASKLGDAIDATEHADIMKQLAEKAGIQINDAI
jgi:hypothetical protein